MSKQITNPRWTAYNNIHNEGGEGYNPHPQYINGGGEPQWSKLMDKRNRNERVMMATSIDDPRYDELRAENAELEIAIKIAMQNQI